MDKKLSVIIPTYNMEKYLRKCLDSLIVSDENMELLEVIIINDGSIDSSSQIAHEYEAKYPQTFKVIDKENGNYGSCINRGLKDATGIYVKVLDADDCFNTKEFEELLFIIRNMDVDLVLTDYIIVNEKNEETSVSKFSMPTHKILHLQDYYLTKNFLYLQMHSVVYKRQLLVDLKYNQTEGVSYTDKEWVFLPLCKVNTFYYLPISLYRYLVGRKGQTMDVIIYRNSISQLMVVCISMIEKYVDYQLNKSSMEPLFYFRISQIIKYIYRSLLIDESLNVLLDFDNSVMNLDKVLYQRFNKISLFDRVPYNFICRWRQHGRKPLPYVMKLVYYYLTRISGNKIP